jgi:hypothetical protein
MDIKHLHAELMISVQPLVNSCDAPVPYDQMTFSTRSATIEHEILPFCDVA